MPANLISRIKKGDAITDKRLNQYGDGVNDLNRKAVDAPRQADNPSDPEIPLEESQTPQTYIESSRVTSQVQVFDQNDENYATVDRIDSITFTNSDGETLTLQFSN